MKWTAVQWKEVLWSDESIFQIILGNDGGLVLKAKEKSQSDCCRQHVQEQAPVIVWVCINALGIGSLHI